MGGIAGIFHLNTPKPVDPARVTAMSDVLAHRGPDGSGIWTAAGIGLGHRRLAIIDIDGGAQPMVSADERITVSFDGAIYNFAAVRAELERLGHVFRTRSDTEVIVHGWRQWGVDCLSRFHGMFAFALFDAKKQSLFLARDRIGIKPLFYAGLSDDSLAFASELKGVLAHPALRRVPDLRAIEDYLAFGYVPDDACIVSGVEKLAAGHYLLIERGKAMVRPVRWWDVDFGLRAEGSQKALEDELVDRMRAAVTSHMVSDLPLGALLSGGVDSAAVVALMAEASNRAVKTIALGFDRSDLDETHFADLIAGRFATEHHKRTVTIDDHGMIDRLADAFDEPFADASALPAYRMLALARENVTVAMSGDGADEVFGGYGRYQSQHAGDRVRTMMPAGLREPLFGVLGKFYPRAEWAPRSLRAKARLQALGLSGEEAYARTVDLTPPDMRARLFSADVPRELRGHRAEGRYVEIMRGAPGRDLLDRAQYADLMIKLPGDILTRADRMSMAAGLEMREPLLDHRLIQFAASLPVNMRLRGGEGKWLMRRAMERYLPAEVLHRPRMEFAPPVSAWFRGPLAGEAERVSRSAALAETGWFDMAALESVGAAHRGGRSDHGSLLWQLMMLDKALSRIFGMGR